MTEEKKDTLKIASPNRLQLTKTVDAGKVKQKFTHGREKAVAVEVRKTRTFTAGAGGTMVEIKRGGDGKPYAGGDGHGHHLTDDERQARLQALKSAEEAGRQRAASQYAETQIARQPEEAPSAPAETTPRSEDGLVLSPLLSGKKQPAAPAAKAFTRPAFEAPAESTEARPERADAKGKLKLGKRGEERRSSGKITVTQALGAYEERVRSLASIRRQREKALKKAQSPTAGAQEKVVREVIIPEAITVQELSNRMAVRAVDLIKVLMKLGVMATVTQTLDADTAELVVGEFGHRFKRVSEADVENVLKDEDEDPAESLQSRPAV
ncbi:MAG: translation initiation factor IF-2 N-terminal domain-containing protein, partial [Alphaproteobacteria bacterium]|nr:translation initiation factor IF-2 N-terminal domain-containing protein [Alphaproteobacteria bacterium]